MQKITWVLPLLLLLFLLAGVWLANYFVDYALRRMPDKPPAAAAVIMDVDLPPPAPLAARAEPWEWQAPWGVRCAATAFYASPSAHRWIIFVHGYGRDGRYTWDYARPFLAAGWNVLAPDLPAAGRSEGEYITMGVRESAAVVAWAQEIAARDGEAEIVLHGLSMGAASVILAAASADLPPQVKAAIEDCGYTDAYEMYRLELKRLYGLPEFPALLCFDAMVRHKTGSSLREAAPLAVVSRVRVPLLFVHGTEDGLTPLAMEKALYEAAPPAKAEFIVTGAGHAAARQQDAEAYDRALFSFLAPYFREGVD